MLGWRGRLDIRLDPVVRESEGRFTDLELFARLDLELGDFLTAEGDGIPRGGKATDLQRTILKDQRGMLSRNLLVPGHGEETLPPSQHHELVRRKRASPPMLSLVTLGDQVDHGSRSERPPLSCEFDR